MDSSGHSDERGEPVAQYTVKQSPRWRGVREKMNLELVRAMSGEFGRISSTGENS
jgi:hypothetical protein